jgi:FixJ family two-component response regulator
MWDGVKLAELMTDNRPRMGVVYMTGHSGKIINMPDHSLIVPKPFRSEDLSEALQKALKQVESA